MSALACISPYLSWFVTIARTSQHSTISRQPDLTHPFRTHIICQQDVSLQETLTRSAQIRERASDMMGARIKRRSLSEILKISFSAFSRSILIPPNTKISN